MLNNNQTNRKLVFIFAAVMCSLVWPVHLKSQSRINSPYSMFGPGELRGNDYFRNLGMGGISQGFRSNVSVNYLNPASYTAVDSLSFIFDGTVFSHLYQQRIPGQQQTTLFSSLGGFNFAFPVTRWWSFAAGLLPWSQVGYRISDFQTDPVEGRVNFLYDGSGGITQVYIGNAVNLFGGLSAGFNAAYLFGRLDDRSSSFSDSIGFYRTTWSNSREVSGFLFTGGLQYQFHLNENSHLTLGASYTGAANLDITQNQFVYRVLPIAGTVDTLSTSPDNRGLMEIPSSMAAGAFMMFNPRWGAGVDFQTQQWSQYRTFETNHNLNDAYQLRFGAVYTPRVETFTGLFNRLEYRGGLRYGQSHLNITDISGTQYGFRELGISFGMAIPVRRSLSALNLGFEFANRSSGQQDMISENFFRFNIGINVYERWFVRRKFF
jgi:hypothetical protein